MWSLFQYELYLPRTLSDSIKGIDAHHIMCACISPATIASLGMFLSNTSARLLRIPAESIAPTLRRIPKKNRTPEKEENIEGNVVLVKCIVQCKCYRVSCVWELCVISLGFVIKFIQHSQNYVFERTGTGTGTAAG